MFKRRREHRPQSRSSSSQCSCIDGGLQFLGGFLGRDGGNVRRLEPAVFLDLVIRHGFQRRFGTHDNDCLVLAIDFSGFTPDKKFADIKFRHVAAFLWKILLCLTPPTLAECV